MTSILFDTYLKQAKKFWGIHLSIKLRPNEIARIPAKWVVSETTNSEVTLEYATEIAGYPNWAVRVIAFHEVCHVKHALKGFPLIVLCLDNEKKELEKMNSLASQMSDFRLKEIEAKTLGDRLGIDEKKTVAIVQDAYVMLTDILVDCELIKLTPVGSDNLRYGNVTVHGDSILVRKPTCDKDRLDGIIEAGLWRAVTEKIGIDSDFTLRRSLIKRLEDLEASFRGYGVKTGTYNQYIKTLSNAEFTTSSTTLESLMYDLCKIINKIENEISN